MLQKFALLIICCLMVSLPGSSAQQSIDWLSGYWEGTGYQAPTDTKWAVELHFDIEENKIYITYPDLSCGGHWEVVEAVDGYAEFEEQITEGQQNCDSQVQVIVNRINEEYVSVAYFLPGQYDGVVAYSVLRKKTRAPKKRSEPGGIDKKT